MSSDLEDRSGLLEAWVMDGLNRGDQTAIRAAFAPGFRDYDPLVLPGLIVPSRRNWGTLDDNLAVVEALASPVVDFYFHIEDVVSSPTRIAYSLFGEGMLRVIGGNDDVTTVAAKVMGDPYRPAPGTARDVNNEIRRLLPTGALIGNNLHIQLRRVGMFRISEGMFVEHRGPWVVS